MATRSLSASQFLTNGRHLLIKTPLSGVLPNSDPWPAGVGQASCLPVKRASSPVCEPARRLEAAQTGRLETMPHVGAFIDAAIAPWNFSLNS